MGNLLAIVLVVGVLLVVGFLILLDQYIKIGIWFQVRDIHHETFAIAAFALAIGVLIGAFIARIK